MSPPPPRLSAATAAAVAAASRLVLSPPPQRHYPRHRVPRHSAKIDPGERARVLDEEVSPVWHNRFAQLLLQYLPTDRPRLTLELHCANAQLTRELMSRLPDQSLLVALQAEPSLDTIARAKLDPRWLARAYVRPGTFDDVTSMQDQSYDLTIANLVLGEVVPDWLAGIQELVRVTKPGGDILATMPLHGTWAEINDIFAEILREAGLTREVALLARLVGLRPRR